MKFSKIVLLIVLAFVVVGCTAGPNSAANTQGADELIAGFWLGLWHGIIAVPAVVVGLFEPTVRVYEVHNNGNWYDLGFVLGIGVFGKGTSETVRRTLS